ncbi:aspartate 1-decarboxylase autocleavage activator PanM [Erwinia sp. S38]|uniref:aspartate 1-decarboxylase autocleavage activator PanM n=1 Tax=Erwinia sp. S38 TaxID=2769338 RepID=UPI00190C6F70|nr:aspartate 1-decarboxylase autocleavage activator PanM [Erwinia sp. S38]MBK0003120.1 aspartate 1-decarboxylase autocleavage activator PanM [Erwinia sp. S38]
MKLTIIRLQQFSLQDHSDLQKIWPQADSHALEQQLDDQHQLYAALFNERLLAAVQVVITGNEGRLSQLMVREVTRRRGVGLYLLEDTLAQNPHITRWQVANDGDDSAETIAAFMQAAGFQFDAELQHYIYQQSK